MIKGLDREGLVAWVLAVVCLMGTGCSSFQGAWKKAGQSLASSQGLEGRWEGTWRSEYNGHHGRLRCVMTRQSNEVYRAWFQARYAKIFSFSYKTQMEVRPEGDCYRFEGEKDLGKWGVYQFEGRADPSHFFSNYRFKKDHGVLEMVRPED